MTNFYITYEEPLKGKCFTESQMKEVYRDLADQEEYPSFDIWFSDMIKSGVFERVTITAHTYVCQLLETVKGCKMCDLEDTIDVHKYYTR